MLLKKNHFFMIIFILLFSTFVYGQVVKLKPYDGTPASLFMAQIKADTLANKGILANRVYELENGQIYLNTESFNVAAGKTIRLRAPQGPKPIIYQYQTGTGSNPQNPPGNLFVLLGGNLEMTNIAVSGIFEPEPASIANVQGGLINTTQVGSSIIIDNCVFNNINGQHIRTGSATKTVKVINSRFANMGSLTTSNFGAGKGLDLREASCDSLILVNNTFVNWQDRVIRHYNFGNPLAGTGVIGYGVIDHNTFVNGMSFHGLLSLGNVGKTIQITNNLLVDAFALGEDSTDVTRSVEWGNTGEKYANDNNRMTWIFTAPNDTTKWIISNNYYHISSTGNTFLTANPPAKIGSPLSLHIQKRIGAAATAAAFKKVDDLTLVRTPKLMVNLMNYYLSPTGGNKTKDKPNYDYKIHDMDRRTYKYFTDSLNCTYSPSSVLYKAGQKGFPVGDLNWFPTEKANWEAGGGTSVKFENGIPTEFALEQNYPNPFNPSTKISYYLPKASAVSLVVYNMLGQEVAKLVNNQIQEAGKYDVTFSGKDNFNNQLTSGIYFYQIRTEDFTSTKKMMLVK